MRNLWFGLLTFETGDKFKYFYTFILLRAYEYKWKVVNTNCKLWEGAKGLICSLYTEMSSEIVGSLLANFS